MASHAVHEETLRTLWRTVMQWGVKALLKAPAEIWSLTNGETMRQRAAKKEVCDSWDLFINSRGAEYIEYLAMPDFSATYVNTDPMLTNNKPERTGIDFPALPRLKVLLTVYDLDNRGRGTTAAAGIFHLTSAYTHNTVDIIELCTFMARFYDAAGNGRAREILGLGMYIDPHLKPGTCAPPIKDRWKYPNHSQHIRHASQKPFHPGRITIIYNNEARDGTNALINTFLDFTHWASRYSKGGQGSDNVTVGITGIGEDQMMRCARAVQKAVAFVPSMACVRFAFDNPRTLITPSIANELDKMLAVLRGTYLKAARQIDKRLLGDTGIVMEDSTGDEFLVWRVNEGTPTKSHRLMTTLARASDTSPPVVLHQDPW